MHRAKSYVGVLTVLAVLCLGRLVFANYTSATLYPVPASDNLDAEVGTSDNWVTGWVWVEWSGTATGTYGGTKRHSSGSWHDGEIWHLATRDVIDTGGLISSTASPSEDAGIARINVTGTSAGAAISRLWYGTWPGDPTFSQ